MNKTFDSSIPKDLIVSKDFQKINENTKVREVVQYFENALDKTILDFLVIYVGSSSDTFKAFLSVHNLSDFIKLGKQVAPQGTSFLNLSMGDLKIEEKISSASLKLTNKDTFRVAVDLFLKSNVNILPVVDENSQYIGKITRDKVKEKLNELSK